MVQSSQIVPHSVEHMSKVARTTCTLRLHWEKIDRWHAASVKQIEIFQSTEYFKLNSLN